MAQIYNWRQNFDYELVQFDRIRLNKIIVVCHNDPEEEKRRSEEFLQTFDDVIFTFHTLKGKTGTTELLRCYEDIKRNGNTQIIFATCIDDIDNCLQCKFAMELRDFLQEEKVIHRYIGHQYKVRNVFFRRTRRSKGRIERRRGNEKDVHQRCGSKII